MLLRHSSSFDLEGLGKLDPSARPGTGEHRDPSGEANKIAIQLVDVAPDVGIDLDYHSGNDQAGVFRLPRANGGGLAVIDFDLDSFPDIYVAQTDGTPALRDSSPNQMMWNRATTFREATEVSRSGDRGFAQGIAVGDVNQDGFPDLVIANIGPNVILINCGDGTFSDQSHRFTELRNDWTSSIAIGDLNGDALPEIVEVNYINDQRAFHRQCKDVFDSCSPAAFTAAHDVIHLADANGNYAPWHTWAQNREASEIPVAYGFGAIIANFDRKNGNDLFIGNDAVKNHYWVSTTGDKDKSNAIPSAGYQLRESAALLGCGTGESGASQACMGIAAGDFDRNGRLDLHITNFFADTSNLFLQDDAGIFTDKVLNAGLYESSEQVLGFGTQAADFNNDGWLDLSVLNGHIYDARSSGVPYQMKPQLFSGSGKRFIGTEPDSASYWNQPQLGRSLAQLDWNVDGRVDLVALHMDRPVALLENQTAGSGNWVQLELVGMKSERDAIGATVLLEKWGWPVDCVEHWWRRIYVLERVSVVYRNRRRTQAAPHPNRLAQRRGVRVF